MIKDRHSDFSYSLNKIILDLPRVFFGLAEAGNLYPESGLLQNSQVASLRLMNQQVEIDWMTCVWVIYHTKKLLIDMKRLEAAVVVIDCVHWYR